MFLFESLLLLLGVAVVLLHLARRLCVPYPAMLALAGGLVAALPWVPRIGIEPSLVLALFVAPAVMDTAFDMPPRELVEWRRLGRIDDDAYHWLEESLDRADLGAQGPV